MYRLLHLLRNSRAAIDLVSIMVGVIIIGVIAGALSTTVFAVIPWTQNEAAKQDLAAIHDAETAGRLLAPPAGPGKYTDYAGLISFGLLPEAPPKAKVAVFTDGTAGTCWIAASLSGSGDAWYTTAKSKTTYKFEDSQEDVDRTSWCATLDPLAKIVEDLRGQPEPKAPEFNAVTWADGTVGVSYSNTVKATGYPKAITYAAVGAPSWFTINSTTGAVTGTPTAAGKFDFTITAANTTGTTTMNVTIKVYGMPMFASATGIGVELDRNGSVWTWGTGAAGALGRGPLTTGPAAALTFPAGVTIASVAAGLDHTVALDGDGQLWAWGANSNGQLGTGDTVAKQTPTKVLVGQKFTKVFAGDNRTWAFDTAGKVWGWGNAATGALGNGSSVTPVLTPSELNTQGKTWVKITASGTTGAALTTDGEVWTWGWGVAQGQASSSGTFVNPTKVAPVSGVIDISSKTSAVVAITPTGGWAWGTNGSGILGDGSVTNRNAPVALDRTNVPAGLKFVSVTLGVSSGTAIDENHDLWVWGSNSSYQLGDGSNTNRLKPQKLVGAADVISSGGNQYGTFWVDGTGQTFAVGSAGNPIGGYNPASQGAITPTFKAPAL